MNDKLEAIANTPYPQRRGRQARALIRRELDVIDYNNDVFLSMRDEPLPRSKGKNRKARKIELAKQEIVNLRRALAL